MGKKVVLLIVTLTLTILIAGWFLLQNVIVQYDVDRDTSQSNQHELMMALKAEHSENIG